MELAPSAVVSSPTARATPIIRLIRTMRSGGGMQTHACIPPPHIFSGKTAALLLHIRQHRVAPHKISGAKQMQTVIGEPLAHAARGRVYHL